jgi:hypothetical protein
LPGWRCTRGASNDRVHRPPARCRHAWLEAQAPDDIFERDLAPLFRGERGIHGDPVGAFDIGAFEFAQMQIADPKPWHQKRPDLRLLGSPASDLDDIAAMLFWALLASGQITTRKVDGWRSLNEKPSDQIIDLAT